jgi:uncharacterized surface protein with fasciclin (FAS1) repeats
MTTIGQEMSKNIVEAAKSNEDLKTLVQAIETAALADTLEGQGPFTVFAPTDDAFKGLATGTLDAWLKDPSKLRSILTYHIIDHKISEDEFHKLTADKRTPSVSTMQGSSVVLKTQGTIQKTRFVNDAKVVKSDIITSNGAIYTIDRVLIPVSST